MESSESLEMTVVWIECNRAAFKCHFKKVHSINCSFNSFFQNSASKMANCIIVDIVNYLITGKLLATHYFLSLKDGVRMRA